nr:uncharacterized protein LOC117833054 [Setaria viridis]
MPISVSEVASQRWCPELNLVRWLICKTTCIAFVSTSRDPFVASRWRRRVIRGVLISGARRGAAETHKKKGIYTRQDYLSTSTRGDAEAENQTHWRCIIKEQQERCLRRIQRASNMGWAREGLHGRRHHAAWA